MTTATAIETYAVQGRAVRPARGGDERGRRRRSCTSATAAASCKQEVETGAMNDDEVVVTRGLAEGGPGAALPARGRRTARDRAPPGLGRHAARGRRRHGAGTSGADDADDAGAPAATKAAPVAAARRAVRSRGRLDGRPRALAATRSARASSSACARRSRRSGTTSCARRLTSLGILFGVASVIAMLAIGKGAEQEILEQMRSSAPTTSWSRRSIEQKEEQVARTTGRRSRRSSRPASPSATREAIRRDDPARRRRRARRSCSTR